MALSLQIGENSDFPDLFSSRTIGVTSTVIYDGSSNQNVTALTYGNLEFGGTNTKISVGNFSIKGNWTNNGTFSNGNDSHSFNGNSNQYIGGLNLTTFYRLINDKTIGSLILNRNTEVSNRLILTNGILELNGNNMYVSRRNSNSISRTNGYVLSELTDMSSTLSWRVTNSTGDKVFPFGKADGTYIPFTYRRVSGNPGTVTLATYPTSPANTPYAPTVTNMAGLTLLDNSANVVDRFWQIDVTGSLNAKFTFTYADNEVPANGEVALRAQRWNGKWEQSNVNIASQTSSIAANTVTANGVTAASPWTLAVDASPLPIELMFFDALLTKKGVYLNWTTMSEINNNYFEIQKSYDGVNFFTIGKVDGAGSSIDEIHYNYLDTEISIYGVVYYQLKQTDFNGDYDFSEPIAIKIEGNDNVYLYQKYNSSELEVFYSTKGESNIKIYNTNGQIIYSFVQLNENSITIDLSNFSKGLYIIAIENKGQITRVKFIK